MDRGAGRALLTTRCSSGFDQGAHQGGQRADDALRGEERLQEDRRRAAPRQAPVRGDPWNGLNSLVVGRVVWPETTARAITEAVQDLDTVVGPETTEPEQDSALELLDAPRFEYIQSGGDS